MVIDLKSLSNPVQNVFIHDGVDWLSLSGSLPHVNLIPSVATDIPDVIHVAQLRWSAALFEN